MANNNFCTHCGNEIDVTSNFCTKCGNKLIIDVNSQTKTTKKKSRNTLQNILIIGGVLFGILLIIILFSRESDSYSAEEKYYPLKTFSGDSTEESGPFLSRSFSINSNKIKLVGIKKQFTNILTICIDSSDDKAPIPKNNCVRFEGDYASEKEAIEFPLRIDKKHRYEISVVADGDWKAEVFEYRE